MVPFRAPLQVAIAGGGIIGLALGLELRLRGFAVTVLERGEAMRGASWAAGGMLAAEDPQNPPELMPLARLSARLYPAWLQRIEELSGVRVPMRTQRALQWVGAEAGEELVTVEETRELAPGLRQLETVRFRLLEEASVDPRDLCAALPRAFVAAGGKLVVETEVLGVLRSTHEVHVRTARWEWAVNHFVDCRGTWGGGFYGEQVPIEPVKGQMVEMQCAPDRLKCVVRGPDIYLIPRGDGRVAVGATIERVGFDTQVEKSAIEGLIRAARELMPELEAWSPLECWAGLRPGTPDGLPVMGSVLDSCAQTAEPRLWHASGHYRDGILLAPATARVMAQAIAGQTTDLPLSPFSARRFAPTPDAALYE